MLIVELDNLAFCTRIAIGSQYLWHFGILRGGRDPDGTRTSVDKIYWYSAERAVGNFRLKDARISFLFDSNGMITLTEKPKSLVWVNDDLTRVCQSVVDFLLNPENAMEFIKGKMLRFRTQLEQCIIEEKCMRTSPPALVTNDIISAPSLTSQA